MAGPSPTGTSRPVSPSAIDSGAPPERQAMLGLRERAASTYTSAHGSRREGKAITSIAFMRSATSRRKPRKRTLCHDAGLLGRLVQLVPELAFADDPELGLRQLAEHDGHRLEQIAVALFCARGGRMCRRPAYRPRRRVRRGPAADRAWRRSRRARSRCAAR